jgi:hypothetical protein
VTLAETQALFHAAVTRAEGDRSLDIQRCFVGSGELGAAERVGIYADMYLWRLVDALREDYPKLAALLGDDRFYAVAEAYVREHPSRHHDLGRLGVHLPAFLRARPEPERPDLADLAALEWARAEVFFEAEVERARPDALAALTPGEFLRARLRLVPALRVLAVEHDALALWRALEHGRAAPPPRPGVHAIAAWRRELDVFHAALELDEAAALEGAAAGDPLSRVCAAFARDASAPPLAGAPAKCGAPASPAPRREDAAQAAFAAIASWFEEGWIASVERG